MYVKVYDWSVLDEMAKGKKVFALDTKNNQVFDLLECSAKEIFALLEVSRHNNRVIFYYWQEESEKNEQM